MSKVLLAFVGALVATAVPAMAQFDSGSDGSDGPFWPTTTTTIDLSLAATAAWDTPSPVQGQGVYDPDLWIIALK